MRTSINQDQQEAVRQHHRGQALGCALSWPVMKRSLLVMILVGSILNIINQGDVIWSQTGLNWWKVALTYFVPFCVATYGAYCAYCAQDFS